jgi:hypothetical protein
MPPRLELSVGTLALDGFGPGVRYACADAFASELERLLAQEPLPATIAARGQLAVPPLTIGAGASDTPSRIGRELARSLHAALRAAAGEER